MDNASECNELYSNLALLYTPSSLVFFGDAMRKPKDHMNLDQKYPKMNLNQSMFERLRYWDRCVLKLENCYRFSPQVLSFINERFYKQTLKPVSHAVEYVKGFCVFHHQNESVMHLLFTALLKYLEQFETYKYGVILPPNISMQNVTIGWVIEITGIIEIIELQIFARKWNAAQIIYWRWNYCSCMHFFFFHTSNRANKEHVMLSSNTNFSTAEQDIVIVWVNEHMRTNHRYRISNVMPAITRAKRAVYFIGSTDMFQVNFIF